MTRRRYVFLIFVVVLFVLSSLTGYSQQGQYVTPGGTKYFLYTPPGYNPATTSYPLLLCLLGGAEIGDDLSIMLGTSSPRSPAWLIDRNMWPNRPFIVVTPQLKRDPSIPKYNDQEWPMEKVDSVLEYVRTTHNIDPNRMYLTGISLGGAACWNYAATFPGKVAAIVPMSGKTNVAQACSLTDIPIWAFHGENDGLVEPHFTVEMIDAINACPSGDYKPHLNLLHARGHEGWNEIFTGTDGYDIYTWLLQFTKNSTANVPPYVYAGVDKKILVRSEPFHITGEYFDPDGTITNVLWTQTSGTALTLENTNSKTLKITGLVAGTFEFQLQVTDNSGVQRGDQVVLQVFNSVPANTRAVTDLILLNGGTNQDIGSLSEGYVINSSSLDEINIRAVVTGPTGGSVRFRVNSDQDTRTVNRNQPLYIVPQRDAAEWTIANGEYTICATPYSGNAGAGTAEITQCFRVTVTDQVLKNYYSKPGSNISSLSSWGSNPDGSGAAPVSFTAAQQVFNISNTVSLSGTLTISGTGSALWVRGGGSLTVSGTFTGAVNVENSATVIVNTAQPVTWGTLGATSSVTYNLNATTVPATAYGNLTIGGGGTKTLASGSTSVAGGLLIQNNTVVNGAADNTSTLLLSGDLTLQEDGIFNPSTKFKVHFVQGGPQALNVSGTQVNFTEMMLSSGTVVTLNASVSPVTLSLGSSTGGGLIINNNGRLLLSDNHLSLTGNASLNSLNQEGELGFGNGNLSFDSQASNDSYLYPVKDLDSLNALTVNLTGGGELFIQDTLNITDFVRNINGTVQSNGNLALISTENKTARIARREGTGTIEGAVQFQRLIAPGKIYRYLSFPVTGATVADLQKVIPVTGSFDGASTDPGLSTEPSLYYYDEPGNGWTAYPATSNTEPLDPGTGYSVFLREEDANTRLILSGEIHQGNFVFSLTPDPNITVADDGWNLVGNPYASPIQWGTTGWVSTGVNATVAVRDNRYPGGRFLVWDGDTGDEEFSGLIAQGQSFWVRTTTATPSLTVQETAKADAQASLFRQKEDETSLSLSVELRHKDLVDRTYLKFRESGSDAFDQLLDAVKQKNGYFNVSTLSTDSVSLAINNLQHTVCGGIPFLLETRTNGTYSMIFQGSALDDPDRRFFLVDHYLDSTIAIGQNTHYTFTIPGASSSGKRFELDVQRIRIPSIEVEANTLVSDAKDGNQWFLNGEEIEGANAQSYTPVESGSYQVRVTRGSCGTLSDAVAFSVTGTPGMVMGQEVRVYPNPASGYLRVKGVESRNTLPKYTIFNMMGVKIKSGEITAGSAGHTIDISPRIPAGVYILLIDNGQEHHKIKFVVE